MKLIVEDSHKTKESDPKKDNDPKKAKIDSNASNLSEKIDFVIEKFSGIRLIKCPFQSEADLQSRLACEFGKFYKFHELWRRVHELKGNKDHEWFTVGILGAKMDPKTSAKGNSYVIWHMYDINNLEKESEVSIFLFGGAYKKHWKSSEFGVFAIRKPEFLDDNKNNKQQQGASKYTKMGKAKNQNNQKVTLSVVNENQLEFLGTSKDVMACQSYKRQQVGDNENAFESSQRCKNLVNVTESKFCLFHCKKITKSGKKEEKGRFSMVKPDNHQSPSIFLPKLSDSLSIRTPVNHKNDKNADYVKRLKEQNVMSLNYNQYDSPVLNSVVFKADRVSDNFLLAKLDNRDEQELKKLRSEKVTYKEEDIQSKNEIKGLLTSKLLLPTESDANTSISASRLLEMKKNMFKETKASNLSTMVSHRDIVKKIKKNTDQDESEQEKKPEEKQNIQKSATASKIGAFDFLKQRVNELKPVVTKSIPVVKKKDDFDLEIFDGDSKTSKRLFDFPIQMENPRTPLVLKKPIQTIVQQAESASKKRKLEESFENEKEAKLKKIEALLNVKSTHAKDANDPDKNPHLKNYLNRLEEKEQAENRLSSCKTIEVRAVTCSTCDYTSFRQSDLCKTKGHQIKRHLAKQRFFKCKNCSKRTYTLDKICPTSACEQCGSEKYESCAMRDDNAQTSLTGDKLQTHLN